MERMLSVIRHCVIVSARKINWIGLNR